MPNNNLHQLHRGLKQHAQGQPASCACYLLLDPQLRPLEPDHPLAQALSTAKAPTPQTTPLPLPFVPEHARPWLSALDLEQPSGSEALSISLQEAAAELDGGQLQRGMGRRIGGWLVSHAPAATLAAHLARVMVQTAPDGQRMLVRVQDSAVLWPLFSLLTSEQRASLLGPIRAWWVLNPAGHLVLLENPNPASAAPTVPAAPLKLSTEQWAHVMRFSALNATINQWLEGIRADHQTVPTAQQLERACAQALLALQAPQEQEALVRSLSHVTS